MNSDFVVGVTQRESSGENCMSRDEVSVQEAGVGSRHASRQGHSRKKEEISGRARQESRCPRTITPTASSVANSAWLIWGATAPMQIHHSELFKLTLPCHHVMMPLI